MRIIHQGLGNIGLGIARLVLDRGHTIVAPGRLYPPAGGGGAGGAPGAPPEGGGGGGARLDVVSTCEELASPWYHHPEEARRLDDLARRRGVTVVGLGVNPGFVMDALPIMLTAPCREVTHVAAERVVDVSQRGAALQRKV